MVGYGDTNSDFLNEINAWVNAAIQLLQSQTSVTLRFSFAVHECYCLPKHRADRLFFKQSFWSETEFVFLEAECGSF